MLATTSIHNLEDHLHTHMDGTVESGHRSDKSRNADQSCSSIAIPTTLIIELGEDHMRIFTWSKHPERNDDREEADNINDE